MRLADYLTKTEESDAAFALRAGLKRGQVWTYRNERAAPNAANLAKIATATSGKVSAADFAPVQAPAPKRARKTS